jgi:sulfite dehydrogenase
VDAYQKNCLICHSARYVAMQPRFPQAVWEKEIKKMVDAYGAVIPDAEQHEIVEYLIAVHGPTENK